MILYEEIDVVESVHQTVLLVAVDVEVFASACGFVGDDLIGEIDFYLHLRVLADALEEFGEEGLAHHHRQYEVVEFVVLVDIGEKGADDHPEAVASYRPGSMLTGGTRTEVLACHEDASAVGGIIEHEVRIRGAVGLIAPVAEEVVAKEFLLTGSCLEEACGDDLVGIHILQWKWHASGCYNVEFLLHTYYFYQHILFSTQRHRGTEFILFFTHLSFFNSLINISVSLYLCV